MELLLMRHGSASWEAASDDERELTPRGVAEVEMAEQWLAQSAWRPEQIWHSPYRRARQTSEIINKNWRCACREVAEITPDNSIAELEAALDDFAGERLMIVSHNPLLSRAINHWQGEGQRYWDLQPASISLIRAEVFAAGCGELQWLRHYPDYQQNNR
jgi:phosphohistidine phosphatase